MENHTTRSGRQKGPAMPQLSCELCRERKVKCDKLDPCTRCVSAGATCIPIRRQRLPRGRHVHRPLRKSPVASEAHSSDRHASAARPAMAVDEDLRRRIHRLEALVGSMSSATTAMEAPYAWDQVVGASETRVITSARASPRSPSPSTYQDTRQRDNLPDPFWTELVEEVQGLRSIMDHSLSDTDEDSLEGTDTIASNLTHGGIRVLGLSESTPRSSKSRYLSLGYTVSPIDKAAIQQLCRVYLQQVDPIIKILHRPSLDKWILQEGSYMRYPDEHPSVAALKSAVCYSAASTMTEDQCQIMFGVSKKSLLGDCREECEAAIERSGLLSTRDITVLQAFVLYLIARRTEDRSRAMWTLVAVAVRIAKGLCLSQGPEKASGSSESFFNQQMRRRLWFTICLIDLQASLGQASDPLISRQEMLNSSTLPRHINDSDFDPNTTQPVLDREGLTDTTFSLVTYNIQLGGRLLGFAFPEKSHSQDAGDNITTTSSDLEERRQYARRFQEDALKLLHFCDPESSPYSWFTWHGTQCLVAGSKSIALRPIYRTHKTNQDPSWHTIHDGELLSLTVQVLEKALLMHSDPRGQGFRWYIAIPLPLLAMAITECYICTEEALARRAWPIVEAAYKHYESGSAWYSSAGLRGPLKKLIQSTRQKLAPLLEGGRSTNEASGCWNTSESSTSLPRPDSALHDNVANHTPLTNVPPSSSAWTSNFTYVPTTIETQQQVWNPHSFPWYDESVPSATMPATFPTPSQEELDQASQMWEEFMTSVSFDNFADLDMSFT